MRRLLPSLILLASIAPYAVGVETSTVVANVAPVVASTTIGGLVSGALSPSAGDSTTASLTITVTDDNGYQDIKYVNVTVKAPDGSTHRATAPATFSSGSLLTGTYTYSFGMAFHDAPALSTSKYKVDVDAKDGGGATTTVASIATFNYNELAALSTVTSLSFGSSLSPGATTAAQAVSVTNTGNVALDVQLSGTSLAHATESASIPVVSVRWAYGSAMANGTGLSTTAATASAFDLAKGASSSKSFYVDLQVPSGGDQWVPSGTYTGSFTIGGLKG